MCQAAAVQQDHPGPPTSHGDGAARRVDVARLVRELQSDPQPRLTWYGGGGARVELTGRVLAQWVAKTAHLLLEEADVTAGSTVRVALGPDWRAPVFWLATWYLGARTSQDPAGAPSASPDVDVVVEGAAPQGGPTAAVTVVVGASALPRPVADLPAGAVDYGAEVSGQPDQLPAPGATTAVSAPTLGGGRVLLGAGSTPAQVLGTWAAGGSVVLHTGLDADELDRVAAQENASYR